MPRFAVECSPLPSAAGDKIGLNRRINDTAVQRTAQLRLLASLPALRLQDSAERANARGRRTGHLFQSRFASVAMDESHLRSAVSYVSLNPVRARLVSRAEEWPWSSVRAHLAGEDDSLVSVRPVLDRWPTFRDLSGIGQRSRRGSAAQVYAPCRQRPPFPFRGRDGAELTSPSAPR